MALEFLPLLAKLLGPQTVVGLRTATDRIIAVARLNRRRNAVVVETQVEEAIRSVMSSAMLEALSGAEVRNQATQLFESKIAALVPLEVFKAVMHEIESHELDVAGVARLHPSYARVIAEAWRQAVEEVIALLREMHPRMAPRAGMTA